MTTKILAILPEAQTVQTCLDTAEAAAACLGDATIEALHVMVDPARMIASSEEVDLQYLRIRSEGSAEDRAAATRAAFAAWTGAHPDAPVSAEWKQVAGMETDVIASEARAFDLLVVPRSHNLDGRDAMFAASYGVERPFLVAPRQPPAATAGQLTKCIVIAWNGTPACRRAAQAAMPFLRHTTRAVVLLIAEGAEMAEDVMAELKAADVRFEIAAVARDNEKLGDQIAARAKALGATLLVMGAHRHGPWIEWLIGHTTDEMLRHDEITLLMSH